MKNWREQVSFQMSMLFPWIVFFDKPVAGVSELPVMNLDEAWHLQREHGGRVVSTRTGKILSA